jgi:rubredoxin
MNERQCPDCDVGLEKTNVSAEGVGDLYVATEREGGILDRLGVGSQTRLHAFLCPECGLTRLYADIAQ